VAGPFAGTSGGALIVAGGANFPDKMPWDGGKKIWHDTAFVLDKTNGAWRGEFKLPAARLRRFRDDARRRVVHRRQRRRSMCAMCSC
jgi:hypothetical protein